MVDLSVGVQIDATKTLWTNEYLEKKMGDQPISVSVTPNGYTRLTCFKDLTELCSLFSLADAVTTAPDGKDYFVEPHVESMTMREMLHKLESDAVR